MRTIAFCEIDPYCRRVLAKHWPDVPIHHDVTKLSGSDIGPIDVICGGFPCQDISSAGAKIGIGGKQSGLWREYARIIGEVRPRYVIVENVAALLHRGLGDVLGDLAALGYDAEWHCIPASAVGAPHRRDRIWIVAYPKKPAADNGSCRPERTSADSGCRDGGFAGCGSYVADSECGRLQSRNEQRAWAPAIIPSAFGRYCRGDDFGAPWRIEPRLGRVAYGLPNQAHRIEALGNAVVPQIPEIIGRAIMNCMRDGDGGGQ